MAAVLIVAPSWVGDMVMAQSLFKVLKAQDEERAIDVLAPGWTRALLERMPEVRQAIDMPLGHGEVKLLTRRRLGIALRAGHYQQVIVLPNSLKSALVPFWARIPLRSGYVGEMRQWLLNDCRRLDKQRLLMTVQRFIALALPVELARIGQQPLAHLADKAGTFRNTRPVGHQCRFEGIR